MLNPSVRLSVVIACALVAGCGSSRRHSPGPPAPAEAPAEVSAPAAATAAPAAAPALPALYEDLGKHHRTVSTKSALAQKCFDQALTLTFAFNHDEAIRLYGEAAKEDPSCAMPHWGIALANGPHINNPVMTPERSRAAWAALERARALASGASDVERDLIEALGRRYSADPAAQRGPMDEAYAEAMRACWKKHSRDADVGTLYAEALMDLQPWDLWTIDGKPKKAAEEIVATIESVLAFAPEHPGANHLYVHAIEASPAPERAVAAADRLRTLAPGAGHLVHMPAHIYIRVGRFADASSSNEAAMAVDERNSARFPKAGFYRIYMAHNPHFLAFSSMMEGRSAAALKAARRVVAGIPREFVEAQGPLIDGFMPVAFHVMVRFGRWEDILVEPAAAADLKVANAVRHYARGVALTALGRVPEAEKEQAALAAVMATVEAERPIGNNPARTVLEIPKKMLAAEIAFRQGRHDEAFATFREAIVIEDGLTYDEPPDWMQPVRHAFGASLLAAKKFEDAERVFREDLRRFPENGWSLGGLSRCLRARGAVEEAKDAAQRMERAFARADVEIETPCFCQPGVSAK
jgi:tetratricopeptide (TPR) repeat protein